MKMNLEQYARRWGLSPQAIMELKEVAGVSDVTTVDVAYSDSSTETGVQQRLRLEASRLGGRLWRNNSGAYEDDRGNWVRYGLGNTSKRINKVLKSSDLIGITPLMVRPKHVGATVAVFTAVECKKPGWVYSPSDHTAVAQNNFLTQVNSLGGFGIFADNEKILSTSLRNKGLIT